MEIIGSALQGSCEDSPTSYVDFPNKGTRSGSFLLTGRLILIILGRPSLVKWNVEIIQITSLTAYLRRK